MIGSQTRPKSRSRRFASAISGTVLGAINIATLYLVVSSFTMSVAADSDKNDALEGIAVSAFVGAVLAFLCLLLTLVSSALRLLRWWWLLPPAIMLAAAVARLVWQSVAYPV